LSYFKRLFSADYRAAVSAEAAGQLEQAAEHYVLAGEHGHAARVHLARADRATGRADRIAALRDALHWADQLPEIKPRIYKSLGTILLEQARAEGVATERDKERVRQAAQMLMRGGDFQAAGEAFESIDDAQRAAVAYSKGGLVDRMERVLGKDDVRLERERVLRDSFATYEMHMRIGERDAARDALRRCVEAADQKTEYRRLLDELESRLITGGLVVLRRRQDPAVAAFAGKIITLGRDNLSELPLRTVGVSRRHAEITIAGPGVEPRFHLADAGSRNGTSIAGMPISGAVALVDRGAFTLGHHCIIEYQVRGEPPQLTLLPTTGRDRGRAFVAGGPDECLDLAHLLDLPLAIELRAGRPHLVRTTEGVSLTLDREKIAHGSVQLIHGDQLVIDGHDLEVL
jgi:tetratricopeptide (TPR) repeat protein